MSTNAATTEPVSTIKLPAIDPAHVVQNYAGFAFSEYFIRLPEDATAEDLKRPEFFKRVQSGGVFGKAFRRFDRLTLVAYDESWFAEARVDQADNSGVVLTRPRIETTSGRYNNLFSDGVFRVIWNGHGFPVERIKDRHVMTDSFPNEALAIKAIQMLYPKRVEGRL